MRRVRIDVHVSADALCLSTPHELDLRLDEDGDIYEAWSERPLGKGTYISTAVAWWLLGGDTNATRQRLLDLADAQEQAA